MTANSYVIHVEIYSENVRLGTYHIIITCIKNSWIKEKQTWQCTGKRTEKRRKDEQIHKDYIENNNEKHEHHRGYIGKWLNRYLFFYICGTNNVAHSSTKNCDVLSVMSLSKKGRNYENDNLVICDTDIPFRSNKSWCVH